MENERMRKLNFGSYIKRAVLSKRYLTELITTVVLALLSVLLLSEIEAAAAKLPPEFLDVFRFSGGYNIGVLTIPSFDAMKSGFADNLILGVVSGSFSQYLVIIIVSTFISDEHCKGYFELALVNGMSRMRLCLRYVLVSVLSLIPFYIVSVGGVAISASLNGYSGINDISGIASKLAVQIVLSACIGVLTASVSIAAGGRKAIAICLSFAVGLTFLPSYLMIFTGIDISRLSPVSLLMMSAGMSGADILYSIVLSLIISAVFVIVSCVVIRYLDY